MAREKRPPYLPEYGTPGNVPPSQIMKENFSGNTIKSPRSSPPKTPGKRILEGKNEKGNKRTRDMVSGSSDDTECKRPRYKCSELIEDMISKNTMEGSAEFGLEDASLLGRANIVRDAKSSESKLAPTSLPQWTRAQDEPASPSAVGAAKSLLNMSTQPDQSDIEPATAPDSKTDARVIDTADQSHEATKHLGELIVPTRMPATDARLAAIQVKVLATTPNVANTATVSQRSIIREADNDSNDETASYARSRRVDDKLTKDDSSAKGCHRRHDSAPVKLLKQTEPLLHISDRASTKRRASAPGGFLLDINMNRSPIINIVNVPVAGKKRTADETELPRREILKASVVRRDDLHGRISALKSDIEGENQRNKRRRLCGKVLDAETIVEPSKLDTDAKEGDVVVANQIQSNDNSDPPSVELMVDTNTLKRKERILDQTKPEDIELIRKFIASGGKASSDIYDSDAEEVPGIPANVNKNKAHLFRNVKFGMPAFDTETDDFAQSQYSPFVPGRFERLPNGELRDQKDKLVVRVIEKEGERKIFRNPPPKDWSNQEAITILNKRTAQQIRRNSTKRFRKGVQPYVEEERRWILANLKKDKSAKPKKTWTEMTKDFNAKFAGKTLSGDDEPRQERTKSSLTKEVERFAERFYKQGKVPEVKGRGAKKSDE